MQPCQPNGGRDDRHGAGQAILRLQFAIREVQAIDRKQTQRERGSEGRYAIPRQETLCLANEQSNDITDGDTDAENEHHQPIGVGNFKEFVGRVHQAKPPRAELINGTLTISGRRTAPAPDLFNLPWVRPVA